MSNLQGAELSYVEYWEKVNELIKQSDIIDTNGKVTAVEWLVETMINSAGMNQFQIDEVIKKSLEMEKQQITDAYIEASPKLEDIIKESAEQYYNKTYKPQNT